MFEAEANLMLMLWLVLVAVKAFALVDCVLRDASRFERAGSLPKSTWLVILALSALAHAVFRNPLTLLNLVGTVAALVYLAQLRGSRV